MGAQVSSSRRGRGAVAALLLLLQLLQLCCDSCRGQRSERQCAVGVCATWQIDCPSFGPFSSSAPRSLHPVPQNQYKPIASSQRISARRWLKIERDASELTKNDVRKKNLWQKQKEIRRGKKENMKISLTFSDYV